MTHNLRHLFVNAIKSWLCNTGNYGVMLKEFDVNRFLSSDINYLWITYPNIQMHIYFSDIVIRCEPEFKSSRKIDRTTTFIHRRPIQPIFNIASPTVVDDFLVFLEECPKYTPNWELEWSIHNATG